MLVAVLGWCLFTWELVSAWVVCVVLVLVVFSRLWCLLTWFLADLWFVLFGFSTARFLFVIGVGCLLAGLLDCGCGVLIILC